MESDKACTLYNGKLDFTNDELMTKYDFISLLNNLPIRLSFPYSIINEIKCHIHFDKLYFIWDSSKTPILCITVKACRYNIKN